MSEGDLRPAEPSSCTGSAHTHRWIRFGLNGERVEVPVDVDAGGDIPLLAANGAEIRLPEAYVSQLLRAAGWVRADPDPVETAWVRRKEWARSRLQDALNRRAR